jgi:hypothetical protein
VRLDLRHARDVRDRALPRHCTTFRKGSLNLYFPASDRVLHRQVIMKTNIE